VKPTSLLLVLISFGFAAVVVQAQRHPFPQRDRMSYTGGFTTRVITDARLLDLYAEWKSNYLRPCRDGGLRVLSGQKSGDTFFTVSEGQAYGMLMAAYFGDRPVFEGLEKVYSDPRFASPGGLMAWRILCDQVDGRDAATDADQDAALALLVAWVQWGEPGYLRRAREVIAALRRHTLYPVENDPDITYMMRIGDDDRMPPRNLSVITDYYAPAYYRVFAVVDGHIPIWDAHRRSGQAYLERNVARVGAATGMNSKIAYPDGAPPPGECRKTGQWGNPCTYNWDASRTPWRQALDVAWYGSQAPSSRVYCMRLTDWVDRVLGIENVRSHGYWPDGREEFPGTGPAIAFVGGFACGALAHSQDRLDRFAAQSVATVDRSYYGDSLRILYYLLITGNMWNPAPFLQPDPSTPVQ
jgi:endoglucanase